MELPTERPPVASAAAVARRIVFGFGARELGLAAVALAVLSAAGLWYRGQVRANQTELRAIRAELAISSDVADVYRSQMAALEAEAARIRTWAELQTTEPLRTWARERVRRFDALVAAVRREPEARAYAAAAKDVREQLAHDDIAGARTRLAHTPSPKYPGPSEFARLRHDLYEAPLADFSRQNPAMYAAFQQFEPEAAQLDQKALRAEIAAAGAENVSPQLMLKVDLLAAVAAPDDPLVADWSALASAMDYFENPDGSTLARWRRAQHAVRLNDWPTAAAEMQSIVISRVRTRQPFRAAYGRALLRSRPDQPAAAYPFLAEAAATGDRQARNWIAQEDYRQRRYAQAQQWLESAVTDGDRDGVPLLLELYQKHADALVTDADRQAGVLQRVTDAPDAPADAWLLLGRLYERKDPPGSPRGKAFACYAKAATKGSAAASNEVARCALQGIGTPVNLEQARDAACDGYKAGDRETAARVLLELMRRVPDRTAGAVQQLFAREAVVGGGGYMETRIVDGPGVTQLKGQLARYLDQIGQYAKAAQFYAGSRDPAAARRHAELTVAHACETCGGTGKVQESVACPTCGGKGKQICSYCGGTGSILVPGSPPCTSCGGSGTMIQDRKVVACAACGGTGKGKGSVIKEDCTHCEHGYVRCTECTNGVIVITKECPDCHGHGTWTLAERAGE